MKAQLSIDPIVDIPLQERSHAKTLEVVANITSKLSQTGRNTHHDRIILAGSLDNGFVDVDRTVTPPNANPYLYGEDFGLVGREYERDDNFALVVGGSRAKMLVVAVDQPIASKCETVLQALGYEVERI